MNKYLVEAAVTISVTKEIAADSKEEAFKKARALFLPGVVSCSPDDDAYWDVYELDGAPRDLTAEELEET